MARDAHTCRASDRCAMAGPEAGLSLLEALVATAIIVMASLSLFAIRTAALRDALHANRWRIARELAETRLSELMAGAHETPPEASERLPVVGLEDEGFEIQIVYGESAIDAVRSQIQEARAAAAEESGEEWSAERYEQQKDREMLRRAQREGVSRWELEDRLMEEEQRRLEEQEAPSEDAMEEVAVFVYFPKADLETDGEEVLELRARISTLAWSGMTPDEAQQFADAQGLDAPADGAPADPNAMAPGGGEDGSR